MARKRGRGSVRVPFSPLTKALCTYREKERFNFFFKASTLDAQKNRHTYLSLPLIHSGSAAIWQLALRAMLAASSSQYNQPA